MKKYLNLDELLAGEPKASEIFNKIPQYTKDRIMNRGLFVGSMDELEAYVNNILRGDS